jgi:hypothetical protein
MGRIGLDQMHRGDARTAARRLPAAMPGAMSAMMNAPLSAPAQGRVSRALSPRDRTWCHRPKGRFHRDQNSDVICAGPALTIRADPVFVRADSSSTVDMIPGSPDLLERHSSFVRAARFQSHPFDILCLPSTTFPYIQGGM